MTVTAPTPSATVSEATIANRGCLSSVRTAIRTSVRNCRIIGISPSCLRDRSRPERHRERLAPVPAPRRRLIRARTVRELLVQIAHDAARDVPASPDAPTAAAGTAAAAPARSQQVLDAGRERPHRPAVLPDGGAAGAGDREDAPRVTATIRTGRLDRPAQKALLLEPVEGRIERAARDAAASPRLELTADVRAQRAIRVSAAPRAAPGVRTRRGSPDGPSMSGL